MQYHPRSVGDSAPTSDEIDEAKARQIGLAKCPSDRTAFDLQDGRAVGDAQ
jgi:hypothetical protein